MSDTVTKLLEGRCRMCERPWEIRPPTRHHLVPKSEGGTWHQDNIIPLCRGCHDLVDAKANGVRQLARRMLRRLLTPAEVAHAIRCKGEAWLDREYPLKRAV